MRENFEQLLIDGEFSALSTEALIQKSDSAIYNLKLGQCRTGENSESCRTMAMMQDISRIRKELVFIYKFVDE